MMLLTLDCSERTVLTDGVPRSPRTTCSSDIRAGGAGSAGRAFCRASWPTTFADSLHTWRHGSGFEALAGARETLVHDFPSEFPAPNDELSAQLGE